MNFTAKVRTCPGSMDRAMEAVEFYVSLLPESAIEAVYRPDPDAPALVVEFTLAGAPYMALNGGPQVHAHPRGVHLRADGGSGRNRPVVGGVPEALVRMIQC